MKTSKLPNLKNQFVIVCIFDIGFLGNVNTIRFVIFDNFQFKHLAKPCNECLKIVLPNTYFKYLH